MNKNLSEIAELAIATARAYYGDFTGLLKKGVKHLPKIILISISIFFVIVILPIMAILSMFFPSDETQEDIATTLVNCLKYQENWIRTYNAENLRKTIGKNRNGNYDLANQAVVNGSFAKYIDPSSNLKQIETIYQNKLDLLTDIYGRYASWKDYETYSVNDKGETVSDTVKKFEITAFFPVQKGNSYSFTKDFGNQRIHNGKNDKHEGTDIFAKRNTPVLAIEDGIIVKIGWNSFGGWRILFKSTDGKRKYYYAHLENYVERFARYKDYTGKVYEDTNEMLKAGEVLGYIGSTGGFNDGTKPGADTGTEPHLHFQFWVKNESLFKNKETLMNPYDVLKILENSAN